MTDRAALAQAWVDGQSRGWADDDWPAYEEVLGLVRNHPQEAWPVVVAIIARVPSEEMLFVVAAGPLEELLERHGPQMIDAVEAEAARDSRFRRCLSGVWGNWIAPEIWARMGRAVRDPPH